MYNQIQEKWLEIFHRYKNIFFITLAMGLTTHMYMFTNKFINWDDLESMYHKGVTFSLGRWALSFIDILFPDYSLPWMNGLMSIVLLALSTCLIISSLKVHNRIFQIAIGAMLVSFPAITGTFSYMFTAAPYCFAILLAVFSVYLLSRYQFGFLAAILPMALSLGIYQAYISFAAALLLILAIYKIMQPQAKLPDLLWFAGKCLIFLIGSLVLYALINQIFVSIHEVQLMDYQGASSMGSYTVESILTGINDAYRYFKRLLLDGWNGIIPWQSLRIQYFVLFACAIILMLTFWIKKKEKISNILLVLLCVALFPLAVNCMFVLGNDAEVHTLVIYGAVAMLIAPIVVIENAQISTKANYPLMIGHAAKLMLILIFINNVFLSNEAYQRLELTFKNTYSFYTSLTAQIKMVPEFDENSKLALIGNYNGDQLPDLPYEDINLTGIANSYGLINAYSRNSFLSTYIGFELPAATEGEITALKESEQYQTMATYPYEGSVQKINEFIVVRFE